LKYVENTEYTENLTEIEKRKLRKQAKHYVSKDKLLYYVSAKGETRRVVRKTEKHRILRTFHIYLWICVHISILNRKQYYVITLRKR
jgi:hypothetical protein